MWHFSHNNLSLNWDFNLRPPKWCYSFNYSVFSNWITTRISRSYLLSSVQHKFKFYCLNVAVKYLYFGTLINNLLHIHLLCRCCWAWFHLMYLSNLHSQIWLFFLCNLHSFPAAHLIKCNFRLHVCCSHVESGQILLMLTMLAVFTLFSPFMIHTTTCKGLISLFSLFLSSFSQSVKPNKICCSAWQ